MLVFVLCVLSLVFQAATWLLNWMLMELSRSYLQPHAVKGGVSHPATVLPQDPGISGTPCYDCRCPNGLLPTNQLEENFERCPSEVTYSTSSLIFAPLEMENPHFSIGNTSSNGECPIAMSVFGGKTRKISFTLPATNIAPARKPSQKEN